MTESITGKRVALVTDGAEGLGSSLATRFAREGYDIVLAAGRFLSSKRKSLAS